MSVVRRTGLALFLAVLIGVGLPAAGAAQVLYTAIYDFPDPNTAIGEPDSAVWAATGNLSPISLASLVIVDPGNSASLLYSHSATEIGDPGNRATFRVIVAVPPISDASAAWSNDAIGVRIILDDGHKRAVLGFGRDPVTKARQIVVLGATGVAPIPFVWDNSFSKVVEITRLANGNFSISISSLSPGADPPIVRAIQAAQLPPSAGAAMVAWGSGTDGGGDSGWTEAHLIVERGIVPFTSFVAGAQIALGPSADDDRFAVEALFQPGTGSDGINPLTEDVTLEVGTGSWVIPAGSFTRTRLGTFVFNGIIGSARVGVLIRPLRDGRFFFGAAADNAALDGTANPVPISLTIGDDGGTTEVIAWFVQPN